MHPATGQLGLLAVSTARDAIRARLAATALAAGLLVMASGADAAPPQRSAEGPWAKARLLVVAKPGLADAEVDKAVKGEGGKGKRIGNSRIFVIDLPAQASETAVRARLKNHPHFESVELDQQVSANFTRTTRTTAASGT